MTWFLVCDQSFWVGLCVQDYKCPYSTCNGYDFATLVNTQAHRLTDWLTDRQTAYTIRQLPLNNRLKRLRLVSRVAAPCVWTLRAPTRNLLCLLAYLLTINSARWSDTNETRKPWLALTHGTGSAQLDLRFSRSDGPEPIQVICNVCFTINRLQTGHRVRDVPVQQQQRYWSVTYSGWRCSSAFSSQLPNDMHS